MRELRREQQPPVRRGAHPGAHGRGRGQPPVALRERLADARESTGGHADAGVVGEASFTHELVREALGAAFERGVLGQRSESMTGTLGVDGGDGRVRDREGEQQGGGHARHPPGGR
jgi:hypothetical protein